MVSVAPLLALRILFDRDRVVGFAVGADLDVRLTFAAAVARVCRLWAIRHRMLTKLAGRQHGRLRLLKARHQQGATKSDRSQPHLAPTFMDRTRWIWQEATQGPPVLV
jgi:hypothetical protein